MQGKVALMGYKFTGFDMLGDKELSIYTDTKLIPFYLHEDPLISYIPTKSFREVGSGGETLVKRALLDQVFKNLGHYVIKNTNGLQGNEVYIGSRLDANHAGRLRAAIAAAPGRYIAQQFVPLSTVGNQITDLRLYATVTKSEVNTADYFWGRALSIRGDGRVNLHQNGQVIPVFFEGSDTVSSGSTHTSTAECIETNLHSSVGF